MHAGRPIHLGISYLQKVMKVLLDSSVSDSMQTERESEYLNLEHGFLDRKFRDFESAIIYGFSLISGVTQ